MFRVISPDLCIPKPSPPTELSFKSGQLNTTFLTGIHIAEYQETIRFFFNPIEQERAMNILVADRDTSIIPPIVDLIQTWGYQAEGSRSAQETLEKVKEKAFELVLLDMSLPDMSAQDLIIKLKESKPDIGIVTMTDANSSGQEKEIRTLGIVYYMIKPVDEKVLKEILDHISNKKQDKS